MELCRGMCVMGLRIDSFGVAVRKRRSLPAGVTNGKHSIMYS